MNHFRQLYFFLFNQPIFATKYPKISQNGSVFRVKQIRNNLIYMRPNPLLIAQFLNIDYAIVIGKAKRRSQMELKVQMTSAIL